MCKYSLYCLMYRDAYVSFDVRNNKKYDSKIYEFFAHQSDVGLSKRENKSYIFIYSRMVKIL